jgi:hypothetical protein
MVGSHPIVIVLDMDGTIVGNMTPQICHWEIAKHLTLFEMIPNLAEAQVTDDLTHNLCRPGFIDFVYYATSVLHAELFIYTAADPTWANFVIQCIETLVNLTWYNGSNENFMFNRPLFARGSYTTYAQRKRISLICEPIIDALKQKGIQTDDCTLLDNIVVVDDNPSLYADEDCKRIIACNPYMFVKPIDVLDVFPRNLTTKYFSTVRAILQTHLDMKFSPQSRTIHKTFLKEYRLNMWKYKHNNDVVVHDTFWYDVARIFKQEWKAARVDLAKIIMLCSSRS